MAKFVSFKTPGERGVGPPIVVNPDHVIMIEPLGTSDQPRCRLWLALAPDLEGETRAYRDVLGTLREVGLRLQEPSSPARVDPLGTHHRD